MLLSGIRLEVAVFLTVKATPCEAIFKPINGV
jgi:hypothetical protein